MDVREKLVELIVEATPPCYSDVFAAQIADHIIAHGVTVQEWVSVQDRLPDVFEGVLAYCPKRRNIYLMYLNARGEWHFFDKTVAGALLDESVTHWMPLPQPPKGE